MFRTAGFTRASQDWIAFSSGTNPMSEWRQGLRFCWAIRRVRAVGGGSRSGGDQAGREIETLTGKRVAGIAGIFPGNFGALGSPSRNRVC